MRTHAQNEDGRTSQLFFERCPPHQNLFQIRGKEFHPQPKESAMHFFFKDSSPCFF